MTVATSVGGNESGKIKDNRGNKLIPKMALALMLGLTGCNCADEVSRLEANVKQLHTELFALTAEKKELERKLEDALATKQARATYPDKNEFDELETESALRPLTKALLDRYRTFADRYPDSALKPKVFNRLQQLDLEFVRQQETPPLPTPPVPIVLLKDLLAFPEAYLQQDIQIEGFLQHGFGFGGPVVRDDSGREITIDDGKTRRQPGAFDQMLDGRKRYFGRFIVTPIRNPNNSSRSPEILYVLKSHKLLSQSF